MRYGPELVATAVRTFAMVLVSFICVSPLIYALLTAFKSSAELFSTDILPSSWNLQNFSAIFAEQTFGRNILNSLFVASLVTGVSLVLGVGAAYALGRVRFSGRGALLMTILCVSMFPQVAILAGLFELIRGLHLYNSLSGLILANTVLTLPFTIWVLTTFMRELPVEIEEAAIIDGASPLTLVIRIFLPLLWPALVTTALLAFISAWNEFLFALTFTLSNNERTVPVAIALMTGSSAHELPWGQIMAAAVVVTLPLIGLVVIFQRKIVAGLTSGAVKG